MDPAVFRHQYRVTYADCTVGNHVYYARYLDILESARGEFFRHLGVTFLQWQDQDVIFPVIECRLRYKAPARYHDQLTIELCVIAPSSPALSSAAASSTTPAPCASTPRPTTSAPPSATNPSAFPPLSFNPFTPTSARPDRFIRKYPQRVFSLLVANICKYPFHPFASD